MINPDLAIPLIALTHSWNQYNYTVLARGDGDPEEPDEDYDTSTLYFAISHNIPDDEIRDFLNCVFPSSRCQHSYDCCGRWYKRGARILSNANGILVIQQTSSLNI